VNLYDKGGKCIIYSFSPAGKVSPKQSPKREYGTLLQRDTYNFFHNLDFIFKKRTLKLIKVARRIRVCIIVSTLAITKIAFYKQFFKI
jgi:hypothetical protein